MRWPLPPLAAVAALALPAADGGRAAPIRLNIRRGERGDACSSPVGGPPLTILDKAGPMPIRTTACGTKLMHGPVPRAEGSVPLVLDEEV